MGGCFAHRRLLPSCRLYEQEAEGQKRIKTHCTLCLCCGFSKVYCGQTRTNFLAVWLNPAVIVWFLRKMNACP